MKQRCCCCQVFIKCSVSCLILNPPRAGFPPLHRHLAFWLPLKQSRSQGFLTHPPNHPLTHTHTHTESCFYQAISLQTMQVWRTKHSTNDTVTGYTVTFISLLRTKKFLDKHSPLDCRISLDVIAMKPIERNSYYRKQQGIWRVLGLEPKGKCGRMCFAADCHEKSGSLKSF